MLQAKGTLNLGVKDDQLNQRIIFWHFIAFVCALPFDRLYSQVAFYSLCIFVLLQLNRFSIIGFSFKKWLILSFLFISTALTIFYSINKPEGLKIIERQSVFFLFPLLLLITRNQWENNREKILLFFSLTCVAVLLYLFGVVFKAILQNSIGIQNFWNENFTGQNFSAPIDMHATYFSMYLFLALSVFINRFFLSTDKRLKIIYAGLCMFCAAGLLQLFSRAVFFTLLLSVVMLLPFYFASAKRKWKYMIGAVLLVGLLLLVMLTQGSLRERFLVEVKQDLSATNNEALPVEPRMLRWKSALELGMKAPVAGYGVGSEKDLMMKTYLENNFLVSYVNKLNTHNQYIWYFITGGLIGVLFFVGYLISGAVISIRHKDFVFSSFILLLAVVAFSENIFVTNKGIMFISFFFPFFWLSKQKIFN